MQGVYVLLKADRAGLCVSGGICLACRVCRYFYCRSRDWVAIGVCEGGGMDFACWKGVVIHVNGLVRHRARS
jgi:hypothetical protein